MERHQYLASIRVDSERITAAAQLDLSAPVQACAPWTLGELVVHIGRIQRWAAGVVTNGVPSKFPSRPDEGAVLSEWFAAGAAEVISALESADLEGDAWNFLGRPDLAPAKAAFWVRRQAMESAIHRCDAESAVGEVADVDAAIAVDGIDELLDVLAPRAGVKGEGESIHLHATDIEGEWVMRLAPGGLEVERGHGKGDVALKGTASDLYRFVWNRLPAEALEVHGNPAVAALWRDRLSI